MPKKTLHLQHTCHTRTGERTACAITSTARAYTLAARALPNVPLAQSHRLQCSHTCRLRSRERSACATCSQTCSQTCFYPWWVYIIGMGEFASLIRQGTQDNASHSSSITVKKWGCFDSSDAAGVLTADFTTLPLYHLNT